MNCKRLPAIILKPSFLKTHFMQKLFLFVGLFCVTSTMCQLRAQSINNKSWKTYIDAPINDTAIFHIHQDSSFISNIRDEVMVRHHCRITGNTLTIEDFSTDQQGCPGVRGRYKINFTGDSFTLTLLDDPCAGRSQALAGRKWIEVKNIGRSAR
jgi:hypothetical protein